MSPYVKGSRTPATEGCLRQAGVAGVGEASGEETAGGLKLGGAACAVYGDLTAAGWRRGVGGSWVARTCVATILAGRIGDDFVAALMGIAGRSGGLRWP